MVTLPNGVLELAGQTAAVYNNTPMFIIYNNISILPYTAPFFPSNYSRLSRVVIVTREEHRE